MRKKTGTEKYINKKDVIKSCKMERFLKERKKIGTGTYINTKDVAKRQNKEREKN